MMEDKVFNTGETASELKARYNPEGSTLRKAQMRMLEMLVFIDKICRQEDIKYYIEGGTMLGAVRHKGFIPWDDDADIVMPEDDFKRFADYMKAHPHPQFVLQNHETDPGYFGFWTVLRDLKSEYLQDSASHKARKYRGCQVDIFCVTKPANFGLHRFAGAFTFINQKYFVGRMNVVATLVYQVQRCFIIPCCKALAKIIGKRDYYMYPWGSLFREQWPQEIVDSETKDIEFEGVMLKGPGLVEKYLRHQFGETYNELPPVESRLGHKTEIVFYE